MLRSLAVTLLSMAMVAPVSAQQSPAPPDRLTPPALPAPEQSLPLLGAPDRLDCIRMANSASANCDVEMFKTPVYKPAEPLEPCEPRTADDDHAACLYLLEKSPRNPS